jgi:hypothetical protein
MPSQSGPSGTPLIWIREELGTTVKPMLELFVDQLAGRAAQRGRRPDALRRELHLDIGRALSGQGIPLRKSRGGDLATALAIVVHAAEPTTEFIDSMRVCRDVVDTVKREEAEFFSETGLPRPTAVQD